MAWNEPGGGKKDPWGGNDQGPDVDAFLNRLKDSLGRVFGGGGGGGSTRSSGPGGGIGLILLGVLALWFVFDSWQQIDESQRGVVLRFGQYDRTMDQGLNFKWPRPIERVVKVDFTQVRTAEDEVRMLTRDENLVVIKFNVQYKVHDARLFLFGARDPVDTLEQAAESAVREVMGTKSMDAILVGSEVDPNAPEAAAADAAGAGSRAEMAAVAQVRLQEALDMYQTGLKVLQFNLQDARPPQEVKEAFLDAISAREDRERIQSEAEAYSSKILPEAAGTAARIRAEAEGYRAAKIEQARGEAARFTALVAEYRKAPEVTRKRLYLETVQQVLSQNPKVMLGDREGRNVLYLPLQNQSSGAGMQNPMLPTIEAARSASEPEAYPPARSDRRPEREGERR